jgi:hypothetical protein
MGPVTVLVIRGDKNMKHVFLHRTILGSVIAAAVLYAALTLIAIETHAQLLTKLPTLTVVDADGVMVGTVLGFEHGAGLAGTVPFVSFEVDGTLLLIAVGKQRFAGWASHLFFAQQDCQGQPYLAQYLEMVPEIQRPRRIILSLPKVQAHVIAAMVRRDPRCHEHLASVACDETAVLGAPSQLFRSGRSEGFTSEHP